MDLVGFLRITGYNRKDPLHTIRALELLEERWEAGVVVVDKQVCLDGDEFQHFLPAGPEVIQYAATRGLTDTTMWKFKLGSWRQFMTMPNFEEGKLVGIKLRRIEPGEPRFFSLKGSRQGMFNYDAVEFNTGAVLIVKGEIPCMLLD